MPQGKAKIQVKTDRGLVLTKEHGFTVEEADGKVLGFDIVETEEYGGALLFGDQIFFLKFWDDDDLNKAEAIVQRAVLKERTRRNGNPGS